MSTEWGDESNLPSVEEVLRTAVRFVKFGRQGWTQRLASVSLDFQPFVNCGRRRLFRRLVDDMKEDLRFYAESRKWPSSWVIYCEEKLDRLFELYSAPRPNVSSSEGVENNAHTFNGSSTKYNQCEERNLPSGEGSRIRQAVVDNNVKWITSITCVTLVYCFVRFYFGA